MAVPQAQVQQRQDLSSFYIGNINDATRLKQQNFTNALDAVKTAYGIGSDVYTKAREAEATRAKGLDAKAQQILTRDGTGQPDRAYLRARMVLNPDFAKEMAELDRYYTKGTFLRDPADEQDTEKYLKDLLGSDPNASEVTRAYIKQFGKRVDASERKILADMVQVTRGTDQESSDALKYVVDLGGSGYIDPEDVESPAQTTTGTTGQMQEIGLAPLQSQSTTQTGQPPLDQGQQQQPGAPGLLANAGAAASQAQGRMEPRGQVGSTERKPLILGMAPGMTPEITRSLEGTPQMQQAYAAAPSNLAAYWNVSPEAVQAAYAGLSEGGLPTNPQQRDQVYARWAQQIQTALPGIFPPGASPKQTVEEALALRSGAAHTALSSMVQGGQPVLPKDQNGKSVLYVPNTTGATGPSTAPQTGPENKVAQLDQMQPVNYTTTLERPQTDQGGVALGADTNVLLAAKTKQANNQPLSRQEQLALNNLHEVSNTHVRVNGDVLVRGIPLRQLVRDFDRKEAGIKDGIRKLNGMGLTVEDMIDPRLSTFEGYMRQLRPAQAKFVEQNKELSDLLNTAIDMKQSMTQEQMAQLSTDNAATQKEQFTKELQYKYDALKIEQQRIAAYGKLQDPNATPQQVSAAKALEQAALNYNKMVGQYRQMVKGMRPADIDRAKMDQNSAIGQTWALMQLYYGQLSNQPLGADPVEIGGVPAQPGQTTTNAPRAAPPSQPAAAAQTVGTQTAASNTAVQNALRGGR